MPEDILWAMAGSGGAIALTAIVVQVWRCRRSVTSGLDRLTRWWLYEWWHYDRKWMKDLTRHQRAADISKVKVTPRAAEVMREALADADGASDRTLRLSVQPGGDFFLALDQVREGDQVVDSEGEEILAIASALAEVFGEICIDWGESQEGAGFVISTKR